MRTFPPSPVGCDESALVSLPQSSEKATEGAKANARAIREVSTGIR
jgi:hypothetical protein